MDEKRKKELERVAAIVRGEVIGMSHRAKSAHLGSCLSCVDILTALYWEAPGMDPGDASDPERDRFIFSKGHAAMALYAVLAERGFFQKEKLASFGEPGSGLAEHPLPGGVPGVELATGSLGHGLPVGLGMAMYAKIAGFDFKVFVLMSDGECNEGSVWEAALTAPANRADNLTVIVDFNKWQATGRSCEITSLAPLADKWRAFGWSVVEVDGHDIAALSDALKSAGGTGKPLAIIADTIKGKGVSFMEDDNNWHYRIPNAAEVEAARRELGLP
ncbi:MAG TPA: transketolase [bacterium]|nr:transketolase [bacterium]